MKVTSLSLIALLAAVGSWAGCGSSRTAEEHPTWADVEPILRAECLSCHGGSAALTAAVAATIYRFDFFDLNPTVCGAVGTKTAAVSARDLSLLIASSVTSIDGSTRPRMPPLPAAPLAEWEWRTILRWTDNPEKGVTPTGNRPPIVQFSEQPTSADRKLEFSLVLADPDGESAVGMFTLGPFALEMDRPGAFAVNIDTSGWPEGDVKVGSVVCDGWSSATYDLGTIAIRHSAKLAAP